MNENTAINIIERVRTCTQCNKIQDIECFGVYKNKRGEVYRRRSCNSCRRIGAKQRYADYPYVQEAMKETALEHHFEIKYGITKETRDAMTANQNFSCAICGKHQSELTKTLGVDHCHTSGQVRGMLCWNCNTGIGKFRDNPDLLIKAAEYLKSFK